MTHWSIILYFCSVAPCTARYYAEPQVSPYEWQADGATCAHEVPEGATVLPGRVQRGRWA